MRTRDVMLAGAGVLVVLMVVLWRSGVIKDAVSDPYRFRHISSSKEFETILVGVNKLLVETATTPSELEKGLGDRDEIGSDGMLFVLPYRTTPEFWMQGMRFPLDFVWIDCGSGSNGNCEVVDVTENVAAPKTEKEYLPRYFPSRPVTHVLEVNAGWVKENEVKVKDKVGI